MSKEKNLEKLFAEYLDRLLAGEEIEAGPDADEDMRTALSFARKMAALRRSPSSEFLLQSKARLVKKLVEQEALKEAKAKAKGNWFQKLASQPIWQAVGVIVILAIAGLLVWESGVFWKGEPVQTTTTVTTVPTTISSPTMTVSTSTATTTYSTITTTTSLSSTTTTSTVTASTTKTVSSGFIRVEGSTDKESYVTGEVVNIGIALTNITSQTIQIELPPALTLLQMPASQPAYTIMPVKTTVTLSPNETVNYAYSWNQEDNNGMLVPAGNYSLKLEDVIYQGSDLQLIFTNPVIFSIEANSTP